MIKEIIEFIKNEKKYKKDNRELKQIIKKQQYLLKRIDHKCEEYLKLNISLGHIGLRKIKDIANTDLNEMYENNYLLEDE